MALSLNYFNLLPFTPLDGGQIVDTFLFARRPRLRFGFFLLSIGALFARYISPLPKNTEEVLTKYKKVIVAEQNTGQLAGWLRMKIDNFVPYQYNEVKGQPFKVNDIVEFVNTIINK